MPMPAKTDPVKHCSFCDKLLSRKRFNGRLEDLSAFRKRKYCDALCMAQSMVQEEVTKSMYHKRAQEFKEPQCSTCGTTLGLHVHHRNGDHTDNAPANLITLCGSCHLKWHWQNGKASQSKKQRATCKICGKPAKAKGYCQNHYRHWQKYGDPLLTKPSGRSSTAPKTEDGPLNQSTQ